MPVPARSAPFHISTQAPCQSVIADWFQLRHGLAQFLDDQTWESVEAAAGADHQLEREWMIGELVQWQVSDFPRLNVFRDVDRIEEGNGLAAAGNPLHEFDRVRLDRRMQRDVGAGEGEIDGGTDRHREIGDREWKLGAI